MNDIARAVITPSSIITGTCASKITFADVQKPSFVSHKAKAVHKAAPVTDSEPQQKAPKARSEFVLQSIERKA